MPIALAANEGDTDSNAKWLRDGAKPACSERARWRIATCAPHCAQLW